MENIIKQMSDTLQVMKQDILRLEQQYESIMKQAKEKQSDV